MIPVALMLNDHANRSLEIQRFLMLFIFAAMDKQWNKIHRLTARLAILLLTFNIRIKAVECYILANMGIKFLRQICS